MHDELRDLLMEYGCASSTTAHRESIASNSLSFSKLRDLLFQVGSILFEDTDRKIYVITARSGFFNLNHVVAAFCLQRDELIIVGFAKEGIIDQRTWDRFIQKICDLVQCRVLPKKNTRKPLRNLMIILASFLSIVIIALVIFINNVNGYIDATKSYNLAVNNFNTLVSNYNTKVLLTCIDNLSDLPLELDTLSLESEDFWSNAEVMFGSNTKEKIRSDTQTIDDMASQVESAIMVITQITAPSEDWVESRLMLVDDITGIQAVTPDFNPDNILGREGGYSSCIYFTIKQIDANTIPGNNIIEKGADVGGSVEIYENIADAEARCNYLSEFNGTILYSGSYAIVGTMVIRTSYKLSNEEQYNLTNAITTELTSLRSPQ